MLRRRLFQLAGLGLLTSLSSLSLANTLSLGKDYKKVPNPQSIEPHKKQVVEVFYYGCSHCYNLEPSLHEWLTTKPRDVHFERVPAVLNNPNWVFMAKVFLTAQELGIIEQSHLPFFHALHRDKLPLFNLEDIAQFHSQFGTTKQAFIDMFESFKVDQAMRRAQRLTQSYGIEGVPSMIVNGQYLTDLTMTGGHEPLWLTVNQLLKQ